MLLSKNHIFMFGFVMSALLLAADQTPPAHAESGQVPFGDKVSAVIFNYNRTTPVIATSGRLKPGGVSELKGLGFKTILDLRTEREGTADEERDVGAVGMNYHNIPVGHAPITPDQVKVFARLVENKANHPILVHCASANRAGAMWTLYRASRGVAKATALEEGLTVGLRPSREAQVKARLGIE